MMEDMGFGGEINNDLNDLASSLGVDPNYRR